MDTKKELMLGRKASTIIGLPIFCLDHGKKLGSVKDVVYDSQSNCLTAVTMEKHGVFAPERHVITFENIKSIGRDAMMIQSEQAIVDARSVPQILHTVERGNGISGKHVLTESGDNLGRITDVLVDETTGEAVSYELTGGFTKDIGSGRNYVPAAQVMKIGPRVVIVPDKVEITLQEQEVGGLAGVYGGAVAKGRDYTEQASQYTQQQEINLSLGKSAGDDVYDDQGLLIVAKGETITNDVISKAVDAGKMHQVATAAGVGGVSAGYEQARLRVVETTGGKLIGKTVPTDITDNRGNLVIPAGTVVTDETIQRASEYGVLPELANAVLTKEMGRQAGTALEGTRSWASKTWDNITERTKESSDHAARRRVVSEQKSFLKGKVSATDIWDDQGNILLREGEIITPLELDNLDRAGKLDQVKLMPEGQPALSPEDEEERTIHVVVERPDEHERHSM